MNTANIYRNSIINFDLEGQKNWIWKARSIYQVQFTHLSKEQVPTGTVVVDQASDMSSLLPISAVNSMTSDEFISKFGNIIENCSLCMAAVWRHRPFKDVLHLNQLIAAFMDDLPLSGTYNVLCVL